MHVRLKGFLAATIGFMAITALNAWETDFGGMPYYTGKVLPTPQEAVYHDDYIALDNVVVVLGEGLTSEDPRLAVLMHRLRELGGRPSVALSLAEAAKDATVIGLGAVEGLETSRPPPARDEGYIIEPLDHEGRSALALRGHDEAGLLWAVASLNQLITNRAGAPAARRAELYDYPEHARRGYISGWGRNAVEDEMWYIVNFKLNHVAMRRFERRAGAWRREQPESVRAAIVRTGELLTPLGLSWFDGFRHVHSNPELQLNIADGEDLKLVLEYARMVLAAGGGFFVAFDDARFPLHPADIERFGSAREADSYFLNRLYDELSGDYPDARIIFCPPFYWGPGGHSYLESRPEYLRELGRLPEAFDIFWTGPRVQGRAKTPEHVAWITDLIERKPTVWQNRGWTSHAYYFHYHTDPVTAWVDWHYDGFFDEVAAYMPNTHMPASAAAVLTLADYLWNPGAYDAERTAHEAAMKLTGPESYAIMAELNESLSYFDQYRGRASPAAAQNIEEIEEELERLMAAWDRVEKEHGETVRRWTGMARYPALYARFVRRLNRNPHLKRFASGEEEAVRNASEDGLKPAGEGDIFLSPFDFTGGAGPEWYAHTSPRRPATWIHGALSDYPEMRAVFEADPFPPEGDYILTISGQDNDRAPPARIRITVNDVAVFEGGNEFVQNGWSLREFRIPAGVLERYNTLAIASTDQSSLVNAPPWFMLNYAFLRPLPGAVDR